MYIKYTGECEDCKGYVEFKTETQLDSIECPVCEGLISLMDEGFTRDPKDPITQAVDKSDKLIKDLESALSIINEFYVTKEGYEGVDKNLLLKESKEMLKHLIENSIVHPLPKKMDMVKVSNTLNRKRNMVTLASSMTLRELKS